MCGSYGWPCQFLSSLAQDFIEVLIRVGDGGADIASFLSSLAQDFIEVPLPPRVQILQHRFLSSLAQDFIEVMYHFAPDALQSRIPELSSSGLH